MCFNIKLQKIKFNVCGEYKTERKVPGPNRTEREAGRQKRAPQARSNLLKFKCGSNGYKVKTHKKSKTSVLLENNTLFIIL